MKINPKLCITKQQKVVACSCKVTGINSALVVPAIAGYVFEYVHPLSYFSNCQGMIKQGSRYLKELDQQILAGLFISSYQHYDLLDLLELSAQEANAILCTASQASLIEALELVPLFTNQNVKASPIFAMYWKGLQDQHDVNQELTNYVRRLAQDFKTPKATAEERKQMMITVLNKDAIDRRINGGYLALSSSKVHLSDSEEDFEESFKEWKKEVKRLITSMANASIVSAEFIGFLKTINKDRNMITMSSSLRERVAKKLEDNGHPDAKKLAAILLECQNPYDLEIEEASLPAEPPSAERKIKSLREILADKKRQSQVFASDEESLEVLSAAQDSLATLDVVSYDAAIDEEDDSEEDDEEVEGLDDKLNSLNATRSFGEDF